MHQLVHSFQSLPRKCLKTNRLSTVSFPENNRLVFGGKCHQARQTSVIGLQQATALWIAHRSHPATGMHVTVRYVYRIRGIHPAAGREIRGLHLPDFLASTLQIMQPAARTTSLDNLSVLKRHAKGHALAFLALANGTDASRPAAARRHREAKHQDKRSHGCATDNFTSLCHFHNR